MTALGLLSKTRTRTERSYTGTFIDLHTRVSYGSSGEHVPTGWTLKTVTKVTFSGEQTTSQVEYTLTLHCESLSNPVNGHKVDAFYGHPKMPRSLPALYYGCGSANTLHRTPRDILEIISDLTGVNIAGVVEETVGV